MNSPAVVETAAGGQGSPSRVQTLIDMKATRAMAEVAAASLFGFLFI